MRFVNVDPNDCFFLKLFFFVLKIDVYFDDIDSMLKIKRYKKKFA